jgi:hypothetical protein
VPLWGGGVTFSSIHPIDYSSSFSLNRGTRQEEAFLFCAFLGALSSRCSADELCSTTFGTFPGSTFAFIYTAIVVTSFIHSYSCNTSSGRSSPSAKQTFQVQHKIIQHVLFNAWHRLFQPTPPSFRRSRQGHRQCRARWNSGAVAMFANVGALAGYVPP